MSRRIDATSVQSSEIFPGPAAGARGNCRGTPAARRGPGGAHSTFIEAHPTLGYRRLWAMLRFVEGISVNRKAVYRLLMLKGWFVHQRSLTPRPRAHGRRSRAQRSNERWAMDVTHIPCGADGWAISRRLLIATTGK